jgi:hypothetical protein
MKGKCKKAKGEEQKRRLENALFTNFTYALAPAFLLC